jgi:outer membrane lipoprotein SlyB
LIESAETEKGKRNMTTSTPTTNNDASRNPLVRNAWMIAGGLAIAGAGLAAGLTWRPAPAEGPAPGSMQPARTSIASNEAVVTPDAKVATPAPIPAKPAPTKAPTHRAASTNPSAHPGSNTTPLATQRAAVCTQCGVIEGVREIQQKGDGTGLGAVGGAVVGGALGNQVGKGNGRTAMTVLGAIGGGVAGNEVEKRMRSETVYEVRVRMDDGSVRTLTQKTAPTPGARVVVEGDTLRTTRAPEGNGGMMRTSSTSSGT